MTGFSIPTCKDELRRAIPILREHGLKKSACFCAEQLVGLAGGGMDCASPSSAAANSPPSPPSSSSLSRSSSTALAAASLEEA